MKTNRPCWMAIIALGSFVVFSLLARAEDTGSKPAGAAGRKAGAAHDRMKHVADELQLTGDQKEKLKPIFQDEAQKLKALRQDTSLSKQDKRAKLKTIREDINAKVKPILTAEQLEKWNKLREEGPKRHHKS